VQPGAAPCMPPQCTRRKLASLNGYVSVSEAGGRAFESRRVTRTYTISRIPLDGYLRPLAPCDHPFCGHRAAQSEADLGSAWAQPSRPAASLLRFAIDGKAPLFAKVDRLAQELDFDRIDSCLRLGRDLDESVHHPTPRLDVVLAIRIAH